MLVVAAGKKVPIEGFDRRSLDAKLAIAITANFVNGHTSEEAEVRQISGIAKQFHQVSYLPLFCALKSGHVALKRACFEILITLVDECQQWAEHAPFVYVILYRHAMLALLRWLHGRSKYIGRIGHSAVAFTATDAIF